MVDPQGFWREQAFDRWPAYFRLVAVMVVTLVVVYGLLGVAFGWDTRLLAYVLGGVVVGSLLVAPFMWRKMRKRITNRTG